MKCLLAVLLLASEIVPAAQADERAAPSFVLEETGIADLQQRMKAGELTAHAITQLYLDRVAAIDKTGPAINAVIELNPDALAIADQLDIERKSGKVRGPLHGIPVLIKDNIETADKMHTTAGSLALADSIASQDATVAANLRAAGAIIVGKTNLSEWANFRSTHSSSGWSGRGGLTKNPYVLDRNACGSSSGTGAAIAANLASVGIGTETDGSIICPAGTNGLVGIKPTLGPGQPRRNHSYRTQPGYGRTDGTQCHRRGHAFERDRRPGCARSAQRRRREAARRLHEGAGCECLEGRSHRGRAQTCRIQSGRRCAI
jgi:amidase